ncbi:NUDIX domain-containing protein [Haladaptatus sp. W1]|uniref:NUDIX domain-containing protein n=1 Tax=Haladaptatus sp. W1 TaxID=1897478 RepID=UPI000A972F18|nr:NUDIX domain-containing protein [Haladaptatus sp. W1]
MKPEAVRSVLVDRVETRREALSERWGDVPHRVRPVIGVAEYDFPATPDELFPWVAVCFVVEDGRVLLVQDSGHSSVWEPPGGKGEVRSTSKKANGENREQGEALRASEKASGGYREQGETEESVAETAERETREETGIECDVTDLLFTETLRFDYGNGVPVPVLQAGFVARRVGGAIRPTAAEIESLRTSR